MLPFSSVPTVPPVLGAVTVVFSPSASVMSTEPPPGRLMLPSVPTVVLPLLLSPIVISGPSSVCTVLPSGTVTVPSSLGVTLPPFGGVMVVVLLLFSSSMVTLPPSSGVTAPVSGSTVPPPGRVISVPFSV